MRRIMTILLKNCSGIKQVLLASKVTLFPVAAQRLTCGSGSCSGATAECTSAKWLSPTIWKGRTRLSWSCWCSVGLRFNPSRSSLIVIGCCLCLVSARLKFFLSVSERLFFFFFCSEFHCVFTTTAKSFLPLRDLASCPPHKVDLDLSRLPSVCSAQFQAPTTVSTAV